MQWFSRYIVEELQQGTNLVVDRYAYSGVAFSSAKQVAMVTSNFCSFSAVTEYEHGMV